MDSVQVVRSSESVSVLNLITSPLEELLWFVKLNAPYMVTSPVPAGGAVQLKLQVIVPVPDVPAAVWVTYLPEPTNLVLTASVIVSVPSLAPATFWGEISNPNLFLETSVHVAVTVYVDPGT